MTTRTFDALPKPYAAYPKAILSLTRKASASAMLPDVDYVVPALKVDRAHLAAYNEVCGFKQSNILPATYLAVLSQALQLNLMTTETFPFPLIGLVHIRNRIKYYRPIKDSDVITLSCKPTNLAPHDKGLQFDFASTAKVNDELVWECASTCLTRMKLPSAMRQNGDKSEAKNAPIFGDDAIRAQWAAPENIGRKYASVSGDFNPIHIHPLTAKLFGFKTAIAHGMWTKARCLAAMGELPPAYDVDAQFKLPVFLPAKLDFACQKSANAAFELKDAVSGKPHIAGSFRTL